MDEPRWPDSEESSKEPEGAEPDELDAAPEDQPVAEEDEMSPAEESPDADAQRQGQVPPGTPEEVTVPELHGEAFEPLDDLAVLALVDIAPAVKALRPLPDLFHLRRPVTLIGSGSRAHVKVDDLSGVKSEHGAVVFEHGRFRLYPQLGAVSLNGEEVPISGADLANGSEIEIGSARFVFLMREHAA